MKEVAEYIIVKYQDIGEGCQTTFLATHCRSNGWSNEFPDADRFTSVAKARKATIAAGIGGDIIANYGYNNEEVIEQL